MEKTKELKLRRVEKKLPKKKSSKKWYEKFRWFKTSDGFLVIAGRDTSQNEAIVRKHLSPNDIFLHTVAPGGPVTVR